MVDDNADRVHVPGQHGLPERDIEPLWPPEQIDGLGAPTWGAPPSPADYPSLTNGAPTATGWEPPPPPEPSQVDLDLPFSRDNSTAPAPTRAAGPADPGPQGPADDSVRRADTRADDDAASAAGPPRTAPVARSQPESPWAHPPQRHGSDPAPAAGTSTGVPRRTWSEPAQPLPPIPQPPTPLRSGPPPFGAPLTPQHGSAPVPQPGSARPGRPPASGMPPAPPVSSAYPEPAWDPRAGAAPTAEDFARRRQVRPADPVATTGLRAVVNKTGLVKLPPGRHELERKREIEMVRRNFGGLRQVTVVNPKGGAGKTVAILLLAMTFGQNRGGYVLAWDNNETQGTLGMRAQQDFHSRTVRDLLRDLSQFQGAQGRVGDLSQYVRSQGEGMFDVLASDESATGGEMLTAAAFGEIREVVSRFYKLIFVDTGNNVRAQNWQAAMDATDQLVVTMSARNDSAETAARMLDHLEQSGRHRLVRQAVTVVSMPPSRKEIDLPAIQEHFAARTRGVLLAPYERLIDTGEPLRYAHLSSATRDAWLRIAAAVAEGL
ncbi:chromosome partitioning protein [Micromonospora sp. HNM0581]|uniref:chromosome partitioning protein n=1 Tax=Micromonospora sp. HNM0581 TaxID=2716341 RepID=UPI00146AEE2E|nr:chromosome partitioning protein [Micromonospora sp. HNM0581]